MLKIKEEAFDAEDHFLPGWWEQFIPVPPLTKGRLLMDGFVYQDGKIIFPPEVMREGFGLMQDQFQDFAGNFNHLDTQMGNLGTFAGKFS